MPLSSLLLRELFLTWPWKEVIVSSDWTEYCPTFLVSSLDIGDSSLSLWVSVTAWCLHSTMKGCHVIWLLPRVIYAAEWQFLFPDSVLWSLHCYCTLQGCVNFCVYSYRGISLASTPHLLFNFMFKPPKIFAKYPILLLTVSTLTCWGSLVCVAVYQMGFFPWEGVRSRVSGHWLDPASSTDLWHEMHTVAQAATHSTGHPSPLSFKRYPETREGVPNEELTSSFLKKYNIAISKYAIKLRYDNYCGFFV